MLAIPFYLITILALVFWVEQPQGLPNNPLKRRKDPGEELEEWLKRFHCGNRSELKASLELPRYKFYHEIIEGLLQLARRLGGNYQESLQFLREGLQKDRQFEKKLKEMLLGTWLQMGLMMLLTWAFILSALSLVDVKISILKLALILGWQLTGLSLLPILIGRLRRLYFSDIGKLWRMLYILQSLLKVPLSRSEVLTLAGVLELNSIKQKSLSSLVEKLKDLCQRCLQQGGSFDGEVKSLMDELRFQETWHFELFGKRLMVIKLALLSLFFLPSYLAFIFLLLGSLMQLM